MSLGSLAYTVQFYFNKSNHLAFASSVKEAKLFDATYWFLDNLLELKFCGMLCTALTNSSGQKRTCLRTNACIDRQILLSAIRVLTIIVR